jgi:hypothetical protein
MVGLTVVDTLHEINNFRFGLDVEGRNRLAVTRQPPSSAKEIQNLGARRIR